MSVSVQRLHNDDIDSYQRLVLDVISTTDYYSDKCKIAESQKFSDIKKMLNNDQNLFFSAKSGDKIVGFLFGCHDDGTFRVDWIGTSKEFGRKGVAGSLLKHAEDFLRGVSHKIWFDSRTDNKECNSLYKKHGYEIVGQMKNHWHGQDYYLWHKMIE